MTLLPLFACGEPPREGDLEVAGTGTVVQDLVLPPYPPTPTIGAGYPLDDTLRLSEIQMKGSHNSYHLRIDNGEEEWNYDAPPLPEQFGRDGVRAVELDVHYMDGRFGVFQLSGWEDRSTCPWLEDCLAQLRTWSDAHPGHAPIIVYFETKEATGTEEFYEHVESFEQALIAAWPREKAYTPDDLMGGDFDDVVSAMKEKGWPRLGEVRGKVIMVLHDFGGARHRYTKFNGLHGRRMFVSATSMDNSHAGFLALDYPVGNLETIGEYLAQGYMVRTRSDELPGHGGDNWVQLKAALESGAQVVLTDYPENDYIPGYSVEMPGGTPIRCNPITAPEICTAASIEDPALLKSE